MPTKYFSPTSSGLLEPLSSWLQDAAIAEIMLNRPQEIYVEKQGNMQRFNVPAYNEHMLANLFQLIANENHQELNVQHPLLSGNLADGSRIQLVLPPIAKYYTFAIRRKVAARLQLDDYVKQDYYRKMTICNINHQYNLLPDEEKQLIALFRQKDWPTFIKQAIIYRKNIVISGGTSSGKTTYLNACLRHVNITDRLLILEDTREIDTPHPNQVNLLAVKQKSALANISMQDLVQCCLRLRPDRMIMGEIRGKEVLDFIAACNTGHAGSMTSIHANNPHIAFMRMMQMYKQNNVPAMTNEDILHELKETIDIIIQLNKTPAGCLAHSIYYKYMHLTDQQSSTEQRKQKNRP